MKRLWTAGLLVAGAALALPAASQAADWGISVRVGADYGHGPGSRESGPAFRYGYDRGWREGSDEGRNDCRKRRDPRYWREGEYRDGDKGYKRWMGPKWDYAAGFRQGYEAGYRRAYAAFRRGYGRDDDDRYRRDDRYRYDDRYRNDDRYRDDGRYRPDDDRR
jgi:hypothetical protein